jgi:hypothetical protein
VSPPPRGALSRSHDAARVRAFGLHAAGIDRAHPDLPRTQVLIRRDDASFDTSSKAEDADTQVVIRKWFVFSTLKNAFGGSSDTTLTRLRELLSNHGGGSPFPAEVLYKALGIEPKLNAAEIDRLLDMVTRVDTPIWCCRCCIPTGIGRTQSSMRTIFSRSPSSR